MYIISSKFQDYDCARGNEIIKVNKSMQLKLLVNMRDITWTVLIV